jgi:hypothetical protein
MLRNGRQALALVPKFVESSKEASAPFRGGDYTHPPAILRGLPAFDET